MVLIFCNICNIAVTYWLTTWYKALSYTRYKTQIQQLCCSVVLFIAQLCLNMLCLSGSHDNSCLDVLPLRCSWCLLELVNIPVDDVISKGYKLSIFSKTLFTLISRVSLELSLWCYLSVHVRSGRWQIPPSLGVFTEKTVRRHYYIESCVYVCSGGRCPG